MTVKVCQQGEALSVNAIIELAASNSGLIKTTVQSLLSPSVKEVEIDLADAEFIDCAGAGALASLRRDALENNPSLRFSVRPPRPELRRVFTLTGLNNLFPAEHRMTAASRVVPDSAAPGIKSVSAPVAPGIDIPPAVGGVRTSAS
jgi:anti-anti-sigma factor